ncbi:MAG: hypothetical protein R3E02_10025 [Blastomonas sp.]
MNYDWIEIAIMVFIVGVLAYVVWHGGAANPTSTGKLGRVIVQVKQDMRDIEHRVESIEQSLKKMASKDDIRLLDERIKANGVSADEIGKMVERDMATIRAEQRGNHEITLQTREGVRRLEDFFLAKGVGK